MYLARPSPFFRAVAALGFAVALGAADLSAATVSEPISDTALQEIHSLQLEKASRSPVQQKLDSQFIFQLKQNRRQVIGGGLPNLRPQVDFEPDGRVLVDITADVSDSLLTKIQEADGTIISSVAQFHSIRALVPLEQIESLGALTEIRFIRRAVPAQTFTGTANSEGDTTHGAGLARVAFGSTGGGVKVGVLSDSVDFLANSQSLGDLPTNVVVLPGQAGSGSGEGTAMLEIIHDLAPDAQLYFARGTGAGAASFAQNILKLRTNGCDIIVDDILYFDESPFQDSLVAQAVNSVTADGALYFSSAGNNGNLNGTTSTTWEGDFVDGGPVSTNSPIGPFGQAASRVHDYGSLKFNRVLAEYNANLTTYVALFWTDPLGGATNDYDLFVLDPHGTHVLYFSDSGQNGTQDPFELSYCDSNNRIVIVKYAGDGRFLHLQLMANGAARLNISTHGNILGHCATTNAFCVAAINARASFPNPYGATEPDGPFPGLFAADEDNFVEWFSSDGPRRVFFHSDGTPITPGNFSSTGGVVRQKPDLTAADGVTNTVPGSFQPLFYGTSAAAPHAAAIAALLKSYNHSLTYDQVRAALTSTALDIEEPGIDRDSGPGIVMPGPALQYIQDLLVFSIQSVCFTNNTTTLTWNSLTNQIYQVQYTTDLLITNWVDLGSPVFATNITATLDDGPLVDEQRFYRVMVVP